MTTPSPSDDQSKSTAQHKLKATDKVRSKVADETKNNLWQETPIIAPPLPVGLSSEEQAQANEALGFLKDVRTAVRESENLPESIGRYSIVRSLGRGGFAEVFLAKDSELERLVALKIPLFHADRSPDSRLRFEREARLAASLGHPQIVPVYEYGEVGPVRFIAFAWCGGDTLGTWTRQQEKIDFRTASKIVMRLADAVQHAHQRGIVHRDLKPANVLVDDSDERDKEPIWEQVCIADFGLARQFDVDDTTLTRQGQIIGTPAYMAPEQATSQDNIGPGADIWALGMILFELLTGETPMRRSDLLLTIRAIADESVPHPRTLRRDIPKALDSIVSKCLRKNPADRYPTAHALSEDLRRWLADEPVEARRVSTLSKFVLWTKRNPLLAASVSLAIVSLAIGFAVAIWQRNVAVKNLRLATTQTTRADKNLGSAQSLIKEIIKLEKQLRTQSSLSEERSALVKRAAELQMELIKDEVLTPRVRYDTAISMQGLSQLLLGLEDFEASLENSGHVLTLLEGMEHELPEGMTHLQIFLIRVHQRIAMASAFNMKGQFAKALLLYQANQEEDIPEGIDPLRRAAVMGENSRAYSSVCQMMGDHKTSANVLQDALQYFLNVDSPSEPRKRWDFYLSECRLRTSLASDHLALGKPEDAETEFLLAEDCVPKLRLLFPNHPVLTHTEGMLAFSHGSMYDRVEKPELAVKQYEKCRQMFWELFKSNPSVTNHGNVYIVASLALAKSHLANESGALAKDVAEETIKVTKDFPEGLRATTPFRDNIEALVEIMGE